MHYQKILVENLFTQRSARLFLLENVFRSFWRRKQRPILFDIVQLYMSAPALGIYINICVRGTGVLYTPQTHIRIYKILFKYPNIQLLTAR